VFEITRLEATDESKWSRKEPETSQKCGRSAGDHRRTGSASTGTGSNEKGKEPGRVPGHVRRRRRRHL